jgi:hypothetical protein
LNQLTDLVTIPGQSTQEVEMQNINMQPTRHPLMGISDAWYATYASTTGFIVGDDISAR